MSGSWGSPRAGGTGPSAARWPFLGAFALLVVTTQVLWLSYAPVSEQTARALGVGDGAVGDLAVVGPVLFVLLALPAGRLVDRHLHRALVLGAVCTAVGALLRVVDPSSYGWSLTGQVVASVAQPFVLTATTAVAARCFPAHQRPLAITVGSAAQLVGVLVAALTGSLLVDGGGLGRLLVVHAALAVVAAAGVLLLLPWVRVEAQVPPPRHPLGVVVRDPLIRSLALLLLVGVGLFNAVATWLDALMVEVGHPGVAGGLVALTTLSGVIGAAVLPGWAAARSRRREVMVAATVTSVLAFALLAVAHEPWVVAVVLAVEGFVLLAGLPVALEWSEEHLGAGLAGASSAVLLLSGNLGAVLLVLLVQPVVDRPLVAFALLAAVAAPGVVVARRLPAARSAGVRPSPVTLATEELS